MHEELGKGGGQGPNAPNDLQVDVKWDTFPCKHPLMCTAITEVSGQLTTIGGCDKDHFGTKLMISILIPG